MYSLLYRNYTLENKEYNCCDQPTKYDQAVIIRKSSLYPLIIHEKIPLLGLTLTVKSYILYLQRQRLNSHNTITGYDIHSPLMLRFVLRLGSVVLLLTVIFGLFVEAIASQKITLATLEWPPYTGSQLDGHGYASKLVREALKRSGIEVDIEFHQWTRVIGLAKKGEVDGYFPEYYGEHISTFAMLSSPFPGGPLVFFKLKDRDIGFTYLNELNPYTIGTVKSYTNTKEFDDAEFLTKEPVKDDLTNFKKLAAGRIDLLVADKLVGNYLLKEHMASWSGNIEFINPPLNRAMNLYVCFPKSQPLSPAYLKAFNKGLRQMQKDGSLNKLRKEYGF